MFWVRSNSSAAGVWRPSSTYSQPIAMTSTAARATTNPTTIEMREKRRFFIARSRRSHRLVTADLDASQQAAERAGVAERDVLGAAIVPERDRALVPAVAEGELRPVAVLEQEVEQRPALGFGHALEAHRV